jgi:para-nitrobenzyl esterase
MTDVGTAGGLDGIVEVAQGQLQGELDSGVWSFKGVPYAAPPFGPRRFHAPSPPLSWEGVRPADALGPTAPKPRYSPPIDVLLPEPTIAGEDCLNLNVWTPDHHASGLPVVVWIHGGSFVNGTGAAPRYDGAAFARDGVVCVTINYRLGVDGFALLRDAVPNRGLLDQIAALEWVRENIHSFGGDADRVTIAGGSSGAMSVMTLVSMPQTKGLFSRAIAQSGAAHHVLTAETATEVTNALSQMLEIQPTVDGFADVPLDDLLRAQSSLAMQIATDVNPIRWGEIARNLMAFEPVVDGVVVTASPLEQLRRGVGADIDLLIGTNADEQNFFLVPNGITEYVTDDYVRVVLTNFGADVDRVLEIYRASRVYASPGELLAQLFTDLSFGIPAIRVAEARQALHKSTYVYEFAWPSPQYGQRLGACHTLEIPFVFGTLDDPSMRPLVGDTPPVHLGEEVHSAWISFIAHGDPGWPAYGPTRSVKRFDDESVLQTDPRPRERLVWEGIR